MRPARRIGQQKRFEACGLQRRKRRLRRRIGRFAIVNQAPQVQNEPIISLCNFAQRFDMPHGASAILLRDGQRRQLARQN